MPWGAGHRRRCGGASLGDHANPAPRPSPAAQGLRNRALVHPRSDTGPSHATPRGMANTTPAQRPAATSPVVKLLLLVILVLLAILFFMREPVHPDPSYPPPPP